MSVKKRLKDFIRSQNLAISTFEKDINVSNGYVNSISKGIGGEVLLAILEKSPNLNINWLLTGEGEMIKVVQEHSTYQQNDNDRYISSLEKINALQEKEIARLEQEKKALQEEITQLKKDTKPPIPHQSLVK